MRKLATAALAFSAAIFLANYILPRGCLIWLAVALAVLGAMLAGLRTEWLKPTIVTLCFLAVGLTEYEVYCRLTIDRAALYVGETRTISGTVLKYPEQEKSYCRLRIRAATEGFPRFRMIVYDNHNAFSDAKPGDIITFTGKLNTTDSIFGKPYDNYLVNAFFLRASVTGDESLSKEGSSLRYLPERLHHLLCTRAERFFPEDVRAFVKALMLGDKEDFYEDDALYVAMSRSGLMHVVAVSGLHISFLVGLMVMVIGGGLISIVLVILLIWCFVLISGAPSSVIRAAFMQMLFLLAPFVRRENDPITSMSAVLGFILAACPFTARSVSLQLSFAAMAGIIAFGWQINAWLLKPVPKPHRTRLVRYVLGVIASTLSVSVFTLPLTALHFSYVPLLAIFSNIACIWAVSLCFCCAWGACLLTFVPILGKIAVWLCTWSARYILVCAGYIARLPHSVLYTRTKGAAAWLAVSYLLILLGLLLKKRKILRILLPAGLSLAMLCCVLWRTERYYKSSDFISVLNVGQGQCITAFSGDTTAVIDCGNINNLDNAGGIAGEYLYSSGRRDIDYLILTHLHSDHADGVVRLMEMLPVDTLILPSDADDSENLYRKILACARKNGTHVVELEQSVETRLDGMRFEIYKLAEAGNLNERCLMIKLNLHDTDLLVTADAPKKLERALVEQSDLSATDILIAGHHGSKNASDPALLQEADGELAIISVGYNTYGHPAKETLEALKAYGYQVRRTDEDGTIELRLERKNGEKDG